MVLLSPAVAAPAAAAAARVLGLTAAAVVQVSPSDTSKYHLLIGCLQFAVDGSEVALLRVYLACCTRIQVTFVAYTTVSQQQCKVYSHPALVQSGCGDLPQVQKDAGH